MKAILFLGSGVSFASGLPDTTIITNLLLKEKWHNHTNQNFYYGEQPNPHFRSTNLAPRLQKFLTILKEATDGYLKERRDIEANYEDLFYLSQQISDNEQYEIDNAAIAPFINVLRDKTQELCASMPFEREINLGVLASRSCDLIQCVVWHALYNRETPKGLQLITELIKNSKIEKLDIATLNHDLLIEQVLSNEGIKYIDGFGQPDGDVRFFEPELYDKHDTEINMFKLHGSINWYRFRTEEDGKTIDKYGCTTTIDHDHCKDSEGKMMLNLDHKPTFLTGSYNKMSDYGFGIFAKVHHKFFDRLTNCDIMIMSGYGWNDRGINGRLLEWILSSHRKRLILLHRNPETEIKQKSKSAMWHRYDELVNDGRLIVIKKWLSETSIDDIIKVLQE
jgi:hypothetical protein